VRRRSAPAGDGQVRRRRHLGEDPRVIEGDVQAAEPVLCRLDHGDGRRFVTDVADDRDRFAAYGLDHRDQVGEFGVTTAGDHELGAERGEQSGGGVTYARTGARHDGDFVFELIHGEFSLQMKAAPRSRRVSWILPRAPGEGWREPAVGSKSRTAAPAPPCRWNGSGFRDFLGYAAMRVALPEDEISI
jgi:hypothetical protein